MGIREAKKETKQGEEGDDEREREISLFALTVNRATPLGAHSGCSSTVTLLDPTSSSGVNATWNITRFVLGTAETIDAGKARMTTSMRPAIVLHMTRRKSCKTTPGNILSKENTHTNTQINFTASSYCY